MEDRMPPAVIRVWDAVVRLFHWSLVVGVTLAAITGFFVGGQAIDLHVLAGTAAVVLIVGRIVWGFLGPDFARFSDFVRGPRAAIAHLTGRHRSLGHNPLGGWMVLALMAMLVALALTGLAVLGGIFHAGPAAAMFTVAQGVSLKGLHKLLALVLVVMIVAHLGGVVMESRRSRENLARSMITGFKESRPGDPPRPPGEAKVRLAAIIAAGVLLVLGGAAAILAAAPVPNAPVALAGTDYLAQCTDCHMAYHPSLLPAASWKQIMGHLDDHFGEDATIAPGMVAPITAWLTAHAAGVTDSKPAHLFADNTSLSITDAPAWKRIHQHLPDALFSEKDIGSKANCGACHEDAESGWFYPGQIEIPHS
jgi:cytochrome b